MFQILNDCEVIAALGNLEGWSYDKTRRVIHKKFFFKDFKSAFGFISQVALLAEKKNHHPEWVNKYSTVEICLTTHDVQSISHADIDLALAINDILKT